MTTTEILPDETYVVPDEFKGGFRSSEPYQGSPDPELLEEVRGFSERQREALIDRAKYDRYFLAKGVLGYKDVNPYTHGPICEALSLQDKNRRMFLMPRGHLKTTLATITDSVADGLTDPDHCRILILNEIEEKAAGFLSEIKAHFENNELIAELFPHLIPKKTGGPGSKWSGNKACLNRRTNYKEWTWSAAGVGTALAGNHYTKIKGDDLIGFEARESPATMRYAIAFAKTLEPLLIDMDEDYIDFVGTRWAIMDLYREMLKAYGADMLYFSREDIEPLPDLSLDFLRSAGFAWNGKVKDPQTGRKIEADPLTDDELRAKIGTDQPIFPRKFTLKRLHQLSVIDPVLYFAQFKNNPVADGLKDFDTEKLQFFDFDEVDNIVYRDEKGRVQRWHRDQLDIVMTCDPNSGELTAPDLPAISVSAISPKDQVFVFESWSRRVLPDAYVDNIFDMWMRWQPRVLGIEKAGQQSTAFYFKKKIKDLGIYINVELVQPHNRNKAEKIRKALQPLVNTRRLFVRKSQTNLRHQLLYHPSLENDDEIEALAYGADLWRAPISSRQREEEDEAVTRVMGMRNHRTGY